ncbi:geranylgeranylglycerol-phosphate geranylgeranyltransferase [Halegenticoccus tardaugens]|uniref:geranylgeranylglycerol-phosphate geranylgeranyltransferase n=1 Tax=Halegenticoccus tardaugens TaxID=2071624 RepID=UPI00100A58C2|nr:geranylgeranylglycerol-phosphate geranylgeranyltransferase [Halegenticoccus tardaugens]
MTLVDRARGCFELARPGNAVAAGVLTFTGAFVSGAGSAQALPAALAVAATVFATGAGNAVNDYFDREIDRINRPDRPIPRGAVSPRGALLFSAALFLGATVCAALLPPLAIAIAVVNLLALVAYTKFFKGLPGVGNVVVAYLTGSTFLFGDAAVNPVDAGGVPFSDATLVLFGLAAVATLTREIVKDVEDLEGDREEGLRTLPIAIGERPALWLGVVAMLLAALASVLPYLRGTFGLVYLAFVLPADVVMVGAAVRSFRDPSAGQRRLKQGMFLAAGAFVVGRAAAILGVGV